MVYVWISLQGSWWQSGEGIGLFHRPIVQGGLLSFQWPHLYHQMVGSWDTGRREGLDSRLQPQNRLCKLLVGYSICSLPAQADGSHTVYRKIFAPVVFLPLSSKGESKIGRIVFVFILENEHQSVWSNEIVARLDVDNREVLRLFK